MKYLLSILSIITICMACSTADKESITKEVAHSEALAQLGITDSYTEWKSCIDLGGGFERIQTFFLSNPSYKRTVVMSTNGYAATTEAYEGTYTIESSGFTVESSSGQTEDVSNYKLYIFTPSQKYVYDSGSWETNTATPFYYLVEQPSDNIIEFISVNYVKDSTYSFFGDNPTVYAYTNQSL